MALFGKGGGAASSPAGTPAIASVAKAEVLKRHKDETTWRFLLGVRPEGAEVFGVWIEQRLPHSVGTPEQWHRVPVLYDPDSNEAGKNTAIDLARLGSIDLTEVMPREGRRTFTTEQRWIVPHECPNCGGIVDQAKESIAAEPKCAFCGQPLPIQPAPAS